MKREGFTIIEVSILFVVFIIVAFLVAPLSLDDTRSAKNVSRWRSVQSDFINILYSINAHKTPNDNFKTTLTKIFENEIKNDTKAYRINFMNGNHPDDTYQFKDYKNTYSNATLGIKLFDEPKNDVYGLLMYDVNGKIGPNVWGKDVFGMKIYENTFEPFCKSDNLINQKQDCSKHGTGLCCSGYYLMGGSFD